MAHFSCLFSYSQLPSSKIDECRANYQHKDCLVRNNMENQNGKSSTSSTTLLDSIVYSATP